MRSRNTNILQVVILITGIVYIILGAVFYISPLGVFQIFADNVSENWLDLVQDNELVGPLYYSLRAFSAVLFTTGLSQVMPLFDPLKYRVLVYFNGLLFPLMSSALLIRYTFYLVTRQRATEALARETLTEGQYAHLLILVLAVTFTVITILTFLGLLLTGKQAKEGIE